MKKLKVTWQPELSQDFDALTHKKSMFYDDEYTNKIIRKYGSLNKYKRSSDFRKLK